MIDLYYTNGDIFIYNVDDWCVLRKTHRIIGEIIGNTSHIPSLPVKILPEEALLLLKKEIVTIKKVQEVNLGQEAEKKKLDEFEDNLLQYQILEYRKSRRIQLENMIDTIVEQRRKVNDNRTPEEILNEELEKSTVITKKNMIWPIFLCSNIPQSNIMFLTSEDISKHTTNIRSKVFHDLYDRGYYITQGDKFGGDFLVYFGDPLCHHAIFIVRCVEKEQRITPSEIVAFGRLGTSVKKRAVLASLIENKVSYVTINWIDA